MTSAVSATGTERNQIIGLLCTGHLYSHFVMLCVPPMFLIMEADLGVGFAMLGLLVSVMALTTGFGQIPMGFLVDRFGGRVILTLGIGLMSVCLIAAGASGTYWVIFFAFGIAGIGNSVFHPADYAILTARLDDSVFGRAISLHMFSGYMGWAVAYAVMLPMANLIGWRQSLMAVGIFGALITLLMVVRAGILDDTSADAVARRKQNSAGTDFKEGMSVIASMPMIMMFLFFSFTAIGGAGLMSFSVVALVNHHGVDEYLAAASTTMHLVGCAGGVLLGGWLADAAKRHNLVTSAAIAVMALCVASLSFGGQAFWFIAAMMVSSGIAYGISSPSRDVLVKSATPEGMAGVTFGFTSTGLSVGNLVGPVLCGWLMDIGKPEYFFIGIAGIIAISIITVLATRVRHG